MIAKERKILVIDLLNEAAPNESHFKMDGIDFSVMTHSIGWDFETAESLIRHHDAYVDGIALSGIRKTVGIGDTQILHGPTLRLLRAAKRSQVYLGDEIRNLFAEWTLKRLFKSSQSLVRGQKVLFHCTIASPFFETFQSAGARIFGADALVFGGVPLLLKGEKNIERFAKTLKMAHWYMGNDKLDPHKKKTYVADALEKWGESCDVLVTYASLFNQIARPEVLKGKVVFIDFITQGQRDQLEKMGVAQVIEFVPHHPILDQMRSKPFSLLTAAVDLVRLANDSPLNFNDFTLQWISALSLQPNKLRASRGEGPRRCGFIVHPLSQRDLWRAPVLRSMASAPASVRKFFEKSALQLPVFHYGQLKNCISDKTGQEVVCEIYAIMGTPKQLISHDEQRIYDKLVKAAEMAAGEGALLFGLGAYTKIVGDAGVTVAKRASIPVTTGNSYSVATTLWAARVMVEKMGMVSRAADGKRVHGKAMVIGATGSIGRVAALLVSLVFDEVVLVGPRPDKLLELGEEIKKCSPGVKVHLATHTNGELRETDLIVTATSSQSGSVLNIDEVKPGAVICDCSRPLDISEEEAKRRPDVLVIESGEVDLPGSPIINVDIGLPKPSVYACMAETVLLTMEGRYEPFSLSRELSMERVKEIYKIGLKHGAKLSAIRGHEGVITEERVQQARNLAIERLKHWKVSKKEE